MQDDAPADPLLIHVGYHKTGTSWMQRRAFKPRFGYRPLMTHAEANALIVRPRLDFDAATVRDDLAARRAGPPPGIAAPAESGAAPPTRFTDVISSEGLAGNPFYGAPDAEIIARRLAAVAPGARILITIRAQIPAIASIYMQYLRRGGTLSAARFFDGETAPFYYAFDPAVYEYDRFVALYHRLFGAGNVLVLPMEEMQRDALAFVARVAGFAGNGASIAGLNAAPTGVSQPEITAPLVRRLNHLRGGPANPGPILPLPRLGETLYRLVGRAAAGPFAGLAKTRPVRAEAEARFAGRFAPSNRRLAALLGDAVDLGRYET